MVIFMLIFEKIKTHFKKIVSIVLEFGKKITLRHIIIAVCALAAIISAIFIIIHNRPDESIDRIKDIASILGYYNPISFARLFKRHTGMTPGEYRFREVNKSKK